MALPSLSGSLVALAASNDLSALSADSSGVLAAIASTDEDQRTLLHHAAASGSLEVTLYLLSIGALPSVCDDEAFTPLISAASAGHVDVVRALINAGADVGATSGSGKSALHYAASKGHLGIVQMLMEGENATMLKKTDKHGATPFHAAAGAGRVAVLRFLLEQQPGALLKDKRKQTPLHHAADERRRIAACCSSNTAATWRRRMRTAKRRSVSQLRTKNSGELLARLPFGNVVARIRREWRSDSILFSISVKLHLESRRASRHATIRRYAHA